MWSVAEQEAPLVHAEIYSRSTPASNDTFTYRIRRLVSQRLVHPLVVVKAKYCVNPSSNSSIALKSLKYTSSYLMLRHKRSTNMLSNLASTMHADLDAAALEYTGNGLAGEL